MFIFHEEGEGGRSPVKTRVGRSVGTSRSDGTPATTATSPGCSRRHLLAPLPTACVCACCLPVPNFEDTRVRIEGDGEM